MRIVFDDLAPFAKLLEDIHVQVSQSRQKPPIQAVRDLKPFLQPPQKKSLVKEKMNQGDKSALDICPDLISSSDSNYTSSSDEASTSNNSSGDEMKIPAGAKSGQDFSWKKEITKISKEMSTKPLADMKSVLTEISAPWRLAADVPSDNKCLLHTMVWLVSEHNIEELRHLDADSLRTEICNKEEQLLKERNRFDLFYKDYEVFEKTNNESRKSDCWLGAQHIEVFAQLTGRDIILISPWNKRNYPFERIVGKPGLGYEDKPVLAMAYPQGRHYRPMVQCQSDAVTTSFIDTGLRIMGLTASQGGAHTSWRGGQAVEGDKLQKVKELLNCDEMTNIKDVKIENVISILKSQVAQLH